MDNLWANCGSPVGRVLESHIMDSWTLFIPMTIDFEPPF